MPARHAGSSSGAVTPRAIRSRVIETQSEKRTAPAPTISQSVVVNVPGRVAGRAEQERRDRADRVADAEHQPGRGGDIGPARLPTSTGSVITSGNIAPVASPTITAQIQAPPGSSANPATRDDERGAEADQVDPARAVPVGRARE